MAGRGKAQAVEKPPAARSRTPASDRDKLTDALTQQPKGPRRAAIRAAVPQDQVQSPPPPQPPPPAEVDARNGSESSDDAAGDANVAGNQNEDQNEEDGESQLVEAYTSRRESFHARAQLAAAGQPKLDFDKSGVSIKMILIFYLSGILVSDMVL